MSFLFEAVNWGFTGYLGARVVVQQWTSLLHTAHDSEYVASFWLPETPMLFLYCLMYVRQRFHLDIDTLSTGTWNRHTTKVCQQHSVPQRFCSQCTGFEQSQISNVAVFRAEIRVQSSLAITKASVAQMRCTHDSAPTRLWSFYRFRDNYGKRVA